jgi:uncharacterized repeat protein (TIGR03803 family)
MKRIIALLSARKSEMKSIGKSGFNFVKLTCFLFAVSIFITSNTVTAKTPPLAYTELYSFGSGITTDGANPARGLLKQGNFLYGTTIGGGAYSLGTIFKLDTSGKETVLYSFGSGGATDGIVPVAGLIMDSAGNLYGTTQYGGVYNLGTIFKLDTNGNETVLYSFGSGGATDGANPGAGLIMDSAGNLYGTTNSGGAYNSVFSNGNGTIFKLDTNGNETVLYSFGAGGLRDGNFPRAGLIMDSAGNLYGTTSGGGAVGAGTIFKLDTNGNETVLWNFGVFGGTPLAERLIMDSTGNLYGTTFGGSGAANDNGTVFKLDTNGNVTVLYSFAGGTADGTEPAASLIMDSAGNLYGTTQSGGAYGKGTIFKLDSNGNETVLYSFGSGGATDGVSPAAGLVLDKKGILYGTTFSGGAGYAGTVFEIPK